MRLGVWAVAGLCAVGAATPARAQSSVSGVMGGPNLSRLSFRPVDLSNTVAPSPGISAGQSRFNFSALFSKLTIPSYPPKLGTSPLPPATSFPSTGYTNFQMVSPPPVLLGKPRARPFIPPAPFTPSTKTPVGPGSGN
jgi:hypothetical protein